MSNLKKIVNNERPTTPISNMDNEMVEVVFDPIMNCYYDPKTNEYF